MSFEKHSAKTGSIIALRDKRRHFRGFHCPFNYPCSFSLILPVNYHFKSTPDCCAGAWLSSLPPPGVVQHFTNPSHVLLQISTIRFVNQKPIYNMQELICFIFLGCIFFIPKDLEHICACWFQPLYASVHTSICEAIKQALTTHVNCVPHNKLYAYLQKKRKKNPT